MKVSTENVATREVVLTIEPDPDIIQQAMRRAAREISRVRQVPGFRPGRAPYVMAERVFGREFILSQALEEVGPDLLRDALKEAHLEAFDRRQFRIESNEPLVLKINVSLVPKVELADYSALHIEPEPEVPVTEAQIAEEMESLRRHHAQYRPVERPLQMGDQLLAEVKGVSGEEEIVNDERTTINMTDELAPLGFGEALVGMGPGETRQFTLTYPDDFGDAKLAGREVDYTVTVHTVREPSLPEVNDDLAKTVGDYATVAELREAVAAGLKRRMEAERQLREADAAAAALVGVATVEYPQVALERELDSRVQSQAGRVSRWGIAFESYLNMAGQTMAEFRERSPRGGTIAGANLVLAEYAQREGLQVSDSEFEREFRLFFNEMSIIHGDRVQEILSQMGRPEMERIVREAALARKALRHLVARLTGREEKEEPAENAEAVEVVTPAAEPAGSAAPEAEERSHEDQEL